MKTKRKLSKKIIAIIVVACVCGIAGIGTGVVFGLRTGIEYDSSLVQKVTINVVKTEWNGYYALAKTDEAGNYTDEDFKILNFTDLHFDAKVAQNKVTLDNLIKNIVAEQPDLVTITGDTITAALNDKRAKQFAELMEGLGVYWAPILGNHEGDNLFGLQRCAYPDIWADYEHCLMHDDDAEVSGNGNYVINILGSDGAPRESLYFIDTHNEVSAWDAKVLDIDLENSDYDFIKADQIDWYQSTVANINALADKDVKSIMFTHIPLVEYQTAYDELSEDGEVYPGKTTENGTILIDGAKNEGICCSDYNSGMFDAIKASGSTECVIAGHDHINNLAMLYQGVVLAYGQPGGYSTYTMESKHLGDNIIGYTRITIGNESEYNFMLEYFINED